MEDENKKNNLKMIFAAICYELGRLQEDVNAYRSKVMKEKPIEAETVAEDFEFHVDSLIRIVKLFDMDNLD